MPTEPPTDLARSWRKVGSISAQDREPYRCHATRPGDGEAVTRGKLNRSSHGPIAEKFRVQPETALLLLRLGKRENSCPSYGGIAGLTSFSSNVSGTFLFVFSPYFAPCDSLTVTRPIDEVSCHLVLRFRPRLFRMRAFGCGQRGHKRHEKYPLSRRSVSSSDSCGFHPSRSRLSVLDVGLSTPTKSDNQSK